MSSTLLTLLLGVGFLAIFFGLMSVRIIFKKNGEFQGTCATQSPFLNKEGIVCSLCGKDPSECDQKQTLNEE